MEAAASPQRDIYVIGERVAKLRLNTGRATTPPEFESYLDQQEQSFRESELIASPEVAPRKEANAGGSPAAARRQAAQQQQQQHRHHHHRHRRSDGSDLIRGRDGLSISSNTMMGCNANLQRRLMTHNADPALVNAKPTEEQMAEMIACLRPLLELAQSRYTEIQRDAAAALHSLSINRVNKPAFVACGALQTLIKLAQMKDLDIRRNIVGALYQLSMSNASVKRAIVEQGGLPSLLRLARSKNREIGHYAAGAIRELCECEENHADVLAGGVLALLFLQLDSVDVRIRRHALGTLHSLACLDSEKQIMIEGDVDGKLLGLLNSPKVCRDAVMRRTTAATLERLAALQPVLEWNKSNPMRDKLVSQAALLVYIGTVGDDDHEIVSSVLRTIQLLCSRDATRQRLSNLGGVAAMFNLVHRLMQVQSSGLIRAVLTTLLSVVKSPAVLRTIFSIDHVPTVLHLCKYADKKVRRGASSMLKRLTTLPNAKVLLVAAGAVPMILSMSKLGDYRIQAIAATAIGELLEEPANRLRLLMNGVLPALLHLLRSGDPEIEHTCLMALADLSESAECRVSILYAALDDIIERLKRDGDEDAQYSASRIFANLCIPAAHVAGHDEDAAVIGRHGVSATGTDAELQVEIHEEEEVDEILAHPEEEVRKSNKRVSASKRFRRRSVGIVGEVNFDLDGDGQLDAEEKTLEAQAKQDGPGWWKSSEGVAFALHYNSNTLDRIHLKVADSDALGLMLGYSNRTTTSTARMCKIALKALKGL